MLLRIALAAAILAGIGATVLNFVKVKPEVARVIGEREDFKSKYQTTQTELGKTKKDLQTTKTSLDSKTKELDTTKKDLSQAQSDADKARKDANQLRTDLAKAVDERKAAQQDLAAWGALGFSVEQIRVVIADLKDAKKDLSALTNQLLSLGQKFEIVQNRLLKYEEPNREVREPNVMSKVIAVDPKFDFVVLDVGQDKGMKLDGDMLVSRDGKLVAKVRIFTIQRDRCVANVVPGSKLSEIMEGDLAVAKLPEL
jgi:hypothetical protein